MVPSWLGVVFGTVKAVWNFVRGRKPSVSQSATGQQAVTLAVGDIGDNSQVTINISAGEQCALPSVEWSERKPPSNSGR